MKKFTQAILVLLLLLVCYLRGDAQGLIWAKGMGGIDNEQGVRITHDAMGNVLTTGHFTGTIDFDPGPGVYNLNSGSSGISIATFISKLDAAGNFIWAKAFSNDPLNPNASNQPVSITIDRFNNVYTAGYFSARTDFNPDSAILNYHLTSGTSSFISKLDSNGSFIYVKIIRSSGSNSHVWVSDIRLDSSNNIFAGGHYQNSIDFDPGPGNYSLNNTTNRSAFLLKLNNTGNFAWVKSANPFNSTPYGLASHVSLAFDSSFNIYTTGFFYESVDFDPGPGDFILTAPSSFTDIFISKSDSSGNFIWAKRIGDISGEGGRSIEIDANGDIIVVGSYQDTVDFDPGAGTYYLNSGNVYDSGFILKLDSAGNFIWARAQTGTSSGALPAKMVLDAYSNVYICGNYTGTMDFDPGAGTYLLTSSGAQEGDIYYVKLNSYGGFTWAIGMGSVSNGFCRDISIDNYGNIYSTGSFWGPSDFNSGPGVYLVNSGGYNDAFVLKMCQNPPQPGTINGNTSICQGTTNTYSIQPIPGATSYTWTLPGGWTGSSTSNSITTTANSSGGNIRVIANNICGSFPQQTLLLTVNSFVPATPGAITGNSTICEGSTQLYSILPVTFATGYTWTLPSGWIGNSITNNISIIPNAGSGVLTVTANNGCGISAAQTLAISVNPAPSPVIITGNANICAGSSNTYSISPVSGATNYTWILPSGWSGSSITNTISAISNTSSGVISVTANNSLCNSQPQTLAITVSTSIPATPGSITGNSSICSGSSNTYSIPPVNGATNYNWTLPPGWSGTSSTYNITTTANATSGNITVTATNACGTSSTQTLAITVQTAPPTPGNMTGWTTVCIGTLTQFSIPPVSGATSYTWTIPTGWSGSSTGTLINLTPNNSVGTVSVIATNSCGSSSPVSFTVNSVITNPAQPGLITGNNTVCTGSLNTYSVANVPTAANYLWTLPGGWTGNSLTPSITTTAGATGGNITVIANNFCGNSSTRSLAINVTPVNISVSVSGSTLTSGAVTGAYQWLNCTTGNTPIPGATNQSYSPTISGNYAVIVTTNGCRDTSNCQAVSIVGVEKFKSNRNILVYPNPTNSLVSIHTPQLHPTAIEISDALGRVISVLHPTSETTVFDTRGIGKGQYLVKVMTADGWKVERLVVE